MEFFANPWFMAAGGALISSPILIHLINRMRFKRIRWAAMEFLLKSQKRNRRRLIIEQLILLLLRILLVLLAAFLLARYLYSGVQTEGGTKHYVLIDDGLSSTDHWREEGKPVTAFDHAKEEAIRVAENASHANSAQEMIVYMLSDLETPVWEGRLNSSDSVAELTDKLKDKKATALSLKPSVGITRGVEYLAQVPQRQKVLHFIGDFRENKWVTGPEGERTTKAIDHTLETGINLSLLDVASPSRASTQGIATNHDNLAITNLRAETRIISEGIPVEFTVTLHNYGTADKKTHLKIYVNGNEDFNGSKDTDNIPAGGARDEKFTLVLQKQKAAQNISPGDAPDERERKRRAEQEFVRVSAEIEIEETGLQADNYRDMVIEVRKKVPALLIDGNNGTEGVGLYGDVFFLETALQAAKAYDVEHRRVEDLDKINLSLYPSIYLLNVREIKSETAVAKLADYVKRGGSVAYFLGPNTFVPFYNEKLHKEYKGLFPAMLQVNPAPEMNEEEMNERRKDPQPKMIAKIPKDVLFAHLSNQKIISSSDPLSAVIMLAKEPTIFRHMLIARYYPTLPREQWVTEKDEPVRDLLVLPNRKSMDEYRPEGGDVIRQARDLANSLAANKPEYKKYAQAIEFVYFRDVQNALGSQYLFNLSLALDRMLNDPVPKDYLDDKDKADPKNTPTMKVLWDHPNMKGLKERIEALIERVRYGDPLVMARSYGKGRIVACMTTAGTSSKWNDFAAGNIASSLYVPFVMDLQRYLASGGDDLNLLVGESVQFPLDSLRYSNKVQILKALLPEVGDEAKARKNENRQLIKGDQTEFSMKEIVSKDGTKAFDFQLTDTRRPGFYSYTLSQLAQPNNLPEERVYAFNVDSETESDLRRAAKEKLERPETTDLKKGNVILHGYGDDLSGLKARKPDASESPWLYLLILVILIVEQALAVHLSFHLRSDNAAAAPAAAPAAA